MTGIDPRPAGQVPRGPASSPAGHDDTVTEVPGRADDEAAALWHRHWLALPSDADESVLLELYGHATPLAQALPESLPLATALRTGAEVLRRHELLQHAAALGIHELAIRRLLDDPEPTAEALGSLAATYRAQGRLHRVIGCADEVLESYIRHGRADGVARALVRLGSLMIEANRLDTAVNYLTRADKAFAGLSPTVERARAQVLLGQALWLSGDEGAGRRRLRRVLPELPDEDAGQVRQLLDLPGGAVPDPPATQDPPSCVGSEPAEAHR